MRNKMIMAGVITGALSVLPATAGLSFAQCTNSAPFQLSLTPGMSVTFPAGSLVVTIPTGGLTVTVPSPRGELRIEFPKPGMAVTFPDNCRRPPLQLPSGNELSVTVPMNAPVQLPAGVKTVTLPDKRIRVTSPVKALVTIPSNSVFAVKVAADKGRVQEGR